MFLNTILSKLPFSYKVWTLRPRSNDQRVSIIPNINASVKKYNLRKRKDQLKLALNKQSKRRSELKKKKKLQSRRNN